MAELEPNPSAKNDYRAYRLRATHVAERLKLQALKERVLHPIRSFSNYEMVLEFGESSYAFVYNYGSVVFFNVPDPIQEQYLAMIRELVKGTNQKAKIGDTTD